MKRTSPAAALVLLLANVTAGSLACSALRAAIVGSGARETAAGLLEIDRPDLPSARQPVGPKARLEDGSVRSSL